MGKSPISINFIAEAEETKTTGSAEDTPLMDSGASSSVYKKKGGDLSATTICSICGHMDDGVWLDAK